MQHGSRRRPSSRRPARASRTSRTSDPGTISPDLDNRLVLGVSVTERPNCSLRDEVSETDPYIGTRQTVRMRQVAPPQFQLVAQLSGGPGGAGAGGGSVQEFNRELPPPVAYTQQRAVLGIVD